MSSELSVIVIPTSGRMVPEDREIVVEYLAMKEGIKQILTLKDWKKPRTTGREDELSNQLGAWFKFVVRPYMKWAGYDDELEAHYILLGELSYEIKRDKHGIERKYLIHTKDMNTAQMADLYSKAQRLLSQECGITVKDPDPSKRRKR